MRAAWDDPLSTGIGANAARWMALYVIISTYGLDDADVVINGSLKPVPVFEMEFSIRTFFVLAPVIVFLVFLLFQIFLHRVLREQDLLSGAGEISAGSIWIFSDLLRSYFRSRSRRPHGHRIEAIVAWVFISALASQAQQALFDRSSAVKNILPNVYCFTFWVLTNAIAIFYFFRHRAGWISRSFFVVTMLWVTYQGVAQATALVAQPLFRCDNRELIKQEYPVQLASVVDDVCESNMSAGARLATFFNSFHLKWTDAQGTTWYIGLPGGIRRTAQLASARLSRYRSDFGNSDGPHAYLRGANITFLNLRNTQLFDAFARHASIEKSDLSGAFGISVDLAEAFFGSTLLDLTVLRSADLHRSEFFNEHLKGTDFSWGDFSEAKFTNSSLDRVNFAGANMRCIVFDTVTFAGPTNFLKANLSDAIVQMTDMRQAIELASANMTGACTLSSLLPEGISLPECQQENVQRCPAFLATFPSSIREAITSSHGPGKPAGGDPQPSKR
jgi:uncharacterized protein YjbI with pentapeptide repeats